jgi:predicted restriction endonuclease
MINILYQIRYAARSPKWNSVRKKHLTYNPRCAVCGKDKKLEVHHIKPVHKNPELELEPTNLITLCADPCHFIFGHLMDWRSWNSDIINDVSVYYNKIVNRPYIIEVSSNEKNTISNFIYNIWNKLFCRNY